MLAPLKQSEVWFVTGSQNLYGPETLRQVAENSRTIAEALDRSPRVPCRVVVKPVVKTPEEVLGLLSEASASPSCVGLILWMHTFSPAKMWIAGLKALRKPFAHLHTQFNRDLPWGTIDMDFMNLNQAAHGDREFGFICSRLRLNRKVVVGHWEDEDVHARLDVWMRAACAWADSQRLKLCRFGDNMREVAVTEGDKVAAQRQFGYAVNGYGVGNLVARIARATDAEVDRLVGEYSKLYEVKATKDQMGAVRGQARIEIGLRAFLEEGGFSAFTDTFEDLHGLEQLPGLAVQRLMAEGYGFGAEGDWKTAALVRALKVMATGHAAGTSFMEDYTYHLDPKGAKVLGRPHARGLPDDRPRQAHARSSPPRHRGKGRPRPPRLRHRARAGGVRRGDRSRQPLPAGRERGGRGGPRRAAPEAAGGPGACGSPAPTSRWRRRRGSTPEARTTRRSAWPSVPSTCGTSRTWPASSSCSSTSTRASPSSRKSCAGTRPTT